MDKNKKYKAKDLKEIEVTAKAPKWTKYSKDFEKLLPKEQVLNQYLTPFARSLGNNENNYTERIDNDYEKDRNNYIARALILDRNNDKYTDKERQIINSSEYKGRTKEDVYNNPQQLPIGTGDKSMDFLYDNPSLLKFPGSRNILQYLAKKTLKQVDVQNAVKNFDVESNDDEAFAYNYNELNPLNQFLDKDQNLNKAKYKPKNDYFDFMPAYSLKDKLGVRSDANNFLQRFADSTSIDSIKKSPIYKESMGDEQLFRESVNLAHYKSGAAWDKEKNLPYYFISDAWDFDPQTYSATWNSADEAKEIAAFINKPITNTKAAKAAQKAYQQAYVLNKVGNPYKLYDRFYYEPETGNYIDDTKDKRFNNKEDNTMNTNINTNKKAFGGPIKGKSNIGKDLPEDNRRLRKIDSLATAWGVPTNTINTQALYNYGDTKLNGGIPRRMDYIHATPNGQVKAYYDYYDDVTRGSTEYSTGSIAKFNNGGNIPKAEYGDQYLDNMYDPLIQSQGDNFNGISNFFGDPNISKKLNNNNQVPNNASLLGSNPYNKEQLINKRNKVKDSEFKPFPGDNEDEEEDKGGGSGFAGINFDFSLGDVLLPAIGIANQGIANNQRVKSETDIFRRRATQQVYNPNRYGTGSQALFQDGGSVTKLNDKQNKSYQTWRSNLPKNLQYEGNYDLKGLYLSNPNAKPSANLHFPDTYKLPNHPTFSNESKYFNEQNKSNAGHWDETDSSFNYIPYNTNVKDTIVERKMDNGGQVNNIANSDINTLWGGNIDQEGYNSYSNPIINFEGNSHNKGGIGVNYGGNTVEVENESAFVDNSGDLNVFGKMKVPGMNKTFNNVGKQIGKDELKATKTKDKATSLIKEADVTNKYDIFKMNSGEVMFNSSDKKMKELSVVKEQLANTQNMMLDLADNTNMKPEKFSESFAKWGKSIPKAQDGRSLKQGPPFKRKITKEFDSPKGNNPQWLNNNSFVTGNIPQSSFSPLNQLERAVNSNPNTTPIIDPNVDMNPVERASATSTGAVKSLADINNNPGNIMYYPGSEYQTKLGVTKGTERFDENKKSMGYFAKFPTKEAGLQGMQSQLFDSKNYKDLTVDQASRRWVYGNQNAPKAGYANIPDDLKGKKIKDLSSDERKRAFDVFTMGEDSKKYSYNPNTGSNPPIEQTTSEPDKPYIWGDLTQKIRYNTPKLNINPPSTSLQNTPNTVQTYMKPPTINTTRNSIPSNQENFNLGQITPELYALATNSYEAVPSLQYQPQLHTPYQVSFQDQINQNQSSFNQVAQISRQNNDSEYLPQLAAQKYSADQSVLANEFRTNQGISNDVTNKNVDILNNAALTNLNLTDVQMQRQTQARSNTKATNQAAFNSISSKIQQNSLENKTLGVYENMYNYRFDPNTQEAQYMGPEASFTNRGNTITNPQNAELIQYMYDAKGRRTSKQTLKDALYQQNKQLQIEERKRKLYGV